MAWYFILSRLREEGRERVLFQERLWAHCGGSFTRRRLLLFLALVPRALTKCFLYICAWLSVILMSVLLSVLAEGWLGPVCHFKTFSRVERQKNCVWWEEVEQMLGGWVRNHKWQIQAGKFGGKGRGGEAGTLSGALFKGAWIKRNTQWHFYCHTYRCQVKPE